MENIIKYRIKSYRIYINIYTIKHPYTVFQKKTSLQQAFARPRSNKKNKI